MPASTQRPARPDTSRGPAVYFGYCQRSNRYRMMDLPDYVSNVQEGLSRIANDSVTAYQGMFRDYSGAAAGTTTATRGRGGDCGCDDCHCECCVGDADVLVHARCGEIRRIPLTFENDTRRDRPVTLDLGKFVTAGGRDLQWNAQLSETQFTLRPCDEHTVTLLVGIRCGANKGPNQNPDQDPNRPPDQNPDSQPANAQPAEGAAGVRSRADEVTAVLQRMGQVDRCEVGYATIRAEGCLTRPMVVAVAVLPDDCDAYRHPCGCNCCH